MTVARRALVVGIAIGLVAGCGVTGTERTSGPAPMSGTAGAPTGTVVVLAAASLTEAFQELADDFEAVNPGLRVTLSFGASSALERQVEGGVPADVFAAAAASHVDALAAAGLTASDPLNLAHNALTIIVPPDNPRQVADIADLADTSVMVALCQPQVPCGKLAQEVFATAGLSVTPVTQESDVKAVLTKVRLGEVDAGLVYRTDARAAAGEVTEIPLPPGDSPTTAYPVVVLRDAPNPAAAHAFVEFVTSARAQAVLRARGFEVP